MVDRRGGQLSGLDHGEAPWVQVDPFGQEFGTHAGAVTSDRIHDQSVPSVRHYDCLWGVGMGNIGLLGAHGPRRRWRSTCELNVRSMVRTYRATPSGW